MFSGFNSPAPDWRVPVAGTPARSDGWGCACAACRPPASLPPLVELDAAELFRRHPLAHLEL